MKKEKIEINKGDIVYTTAGAYMILQIDDNKFKVQNISTQEIHNIKDIQLLPYITHVDKG